MIIRLAILKGSSIDVDGTTGPNQLYNRGTTPWTLIGTLGTDYGLPDILTFVNKALIINGYEVPYQYDGTTLSHLTDPAGHVPAGAGHHALHQGYYWVWNTAALSATPDGPSSLRSSDINNPNSWPLANQLFIDKDDGDQGMGMGQFTIAEAGISPTTSQIIFKTFASYQMTGVFGSTQPVFAIQKIKTDMGCVAARTIRFAPGFGLIRLTHRGFALFDGVDDRLISEEIRPLIFGSDTYSGIDWDAVAASEAVVIPNPPLYFAACPLQGNDLRRIFCYDLVRRGWSILSYSEPISTVQAITDQGVLPSTLTGDFRAGHVRSIFNPISASQGHDNGVPITWEARLKPIGAGSPQQRGYFARAVLKVFAVLVDNFQIAWSVLIGPPLPTGSVSRAGIITLPFQLPTSVNAGLGYGLQPYGISAYGGVLSASGGGGEADVTIPIGLKGDDLQLTISGQGHIIIRGVEYHVRPGPVARPSTYV